MEAQFQATAVVVIQSKRGAGKPSAYHFTGWKYYRLLDKIKQLYYVQPLMKYFYKRFIITKHHLIISLPKY